MCSTLPQLMMEKAVAVSDVLLHMKGAGLTGPEGSGKHCSSPFLWFWQALFFYGFYQALFMLFLCLVSIVHFT